LNFFLILIDELTLNEQNSLFDLDTLSDSVFKHDRDFIQIILIKDKVQQIYKSQIKQSTVINNVNERLKNKDYIDPSSLVDCENLEMEGNADTVIGFIQWMTKFAHSLNKPFGINLNDLTKMINMANYLSFLIHTNCFYFSDSNEWRFVFPNRIIFSNNNYLKLFGHYFNNLVLEFHSKLQSFHLTENESALLNAFVLFSCNCKF